VIGGLLFVAAIVGAVFFIKTKKGKGNPKRDTGNTKNNLSIIAEKFFFSETGSFVEATSFFNPSQTLGRPNRAPMDADKRLTELAEVKKKDGG